MLFKGSGVALVTPFINEEINYEKLAELIEFNINSKTDALIILGTTGENVCLSDVEKMQIIDFTVNVVNKRIPVIVGTGCSSTKKTIELSLYAKEAGADGLLIVTPYYNKPSQQGLFYHYLEISKHVDLPIILYNVPSRTSVNLTAETVIKLSKLYNIVGIKEASGDLFQIQTIIKNVSPDFGIYSGNDDQLLDILRLGGHGVISVTANLFPEKVSNIIKNYFNGNVEEAEKEFQGLRNINQILFIESNPVPVKTAMNLLGYNVGGVRLPLFNLSEKNLNVLILTLKDLGLEVN